MGIHGAGNHGGTELDGDVSGVAVEAIASTLLVFWAGMHGGTIRHTEVRGELAPILLDLDGFTHEDSEAGHEHSEDTEAGHEYSGETTAN